MDLVTKQKATIWLIVILVLLNLTTILLLWFPTEVRRRPMMPRNDMPRDRTFINELNLSQEQQTQFRQYRREYFKVIRKYMQQINSKKHEMMDLLFQGNPDTLKLDTLAYELGQLNAEFEKVRFGQILKMKSILTSEQFNIFKNIIDEAYKPMPGKIEGEGPPHDFGKFGPNGLPPMPPGNNKPPDDGPPSPPPQED